MINVIKFIAALCGLLFLITPINQIVRAQNASPKWEEAELRSGEVAEIVIAPSSPNVMYAGFEVNSHSLYKSEDGGKSWKKVDGGGDHTKDIAVSPKDPDKVYFAMSEALETTDRSFQSTAKSKYSGGPPGFVKQTQTILTNGLVAGGSSVSFSSVEVFEGDDSVIYAARRGGSGMGGVMPKIFKSTNGGQSWTDMEVNLYEVNVLAIHPENPDTILIGSRDGIYQSRDLGKTLTKLNNTGGIISIEYQISNPDVIYAASSFKAIKSTDGGKIWKDITGSPGGGLKDIHRMRVSRSNPNILYAATFNGVFRSDDGGSSWIDASGPPAGGLKAKNIQIVEIHPQNPDIVFVGHSSLWSSVRSEERYKTGLLAHQGIFKTEDGGKTWVRSDNGIKEYKFEEVAVNPNTPYEAWIASPASRGGYKTEDGGHNFYLSQTPTFHYPMRVKYSLQNPSKLIASGWQNNAPFSISKDGGINWDLISERAFFAGLNTGKAMLRDGIEAIHIHGIAFDPKEDNKIYAGSVHDTQNPAGLMKGAHFFVSSDGGKSWTESDAGFPHDQKIAIHDVVVDPKSTNIIYLATTRHESEKGLGVYKSEDYGKSWKQVSSGLSGDGLSVLTLVVNPQNTSELLVATFGGMYKSTDRGLNWKQTHPSKAFDVEYVIDDPSIVYASTADGVLRSLDFGSNWTKFGEGLPEGNPQGIGVDKTGQVTYAAVENKGVYVARFTEVSAKDPVSRFGKNPYGFGFFGPGGFDPGRFLNGGISFLDILFAVTGLFFIIAILIFGILFWKNRKVAVKNNG